MDRTYELSWGQAQTALREWYASGLGEALHGRIASRAEGLMRDMYALHCLQVGGTQYGVDLLAGRGLIHRIHVTGDGCDGIRAEPGQLPIATRSLDLVVLAHALEFYPEPHDLLREVDRVLKLDGHVLLIGFNPWSSFGLRRIFSGNWVPWSGHFYGMRRVIDWFSVLGLHTRHRETVWLAPPVQSGLLRRSLQPLERWGGGRSVAGGVYLLLARKHSIPLTPSPAVRVARPAVAPPGNVVRPIRRDRDRCGRNTQRPPE